MYSNTSISNFRPCLLSSSCLWSSWLSATEVSVLYLDDLYELVHATVPREDGLAQQKLGQHAAGRPDVDVGRVVGGTKDELWGAIVPWADIGHIRLPPN